MPKTPCPDYDESIVQQLPSMPDACGGGAPEEHRWSGGFFTAGQRNPTPSDYSGGTHWAVPGDSYGGLGAVTPGGTQRCKGCRRVLPLLDFDLRQGSRDPGELKTRCRPCLERAARYREEKRSVNRG